MKKTKIIALALTAAFALSMSACGSSNTATTAAASTTEATETTEATTAEASVPETIDELYDQGYTRSASSYSDSKLTVNFVNADHTDFVRVECAMTDDEAEEFFALDSFSDDYEDQFKAFLSKLSDITIKNMNNDLPDPSEYESYVGKTIEDLEDDGLELAGYGKDDDGKLVLDFYVYPDDGESYLVHVYPEGEPDEDATYDDESILSLVVGKVVFWDFA